MAENPLEQSKLPTMEAPQRPEWKRRSPRHRPKGESERITYVDAVKGFAIVLVVLGHILRAEGEILSPEVEDMIADIIYAFHMPLFFFISGYCRALSERKGLMDAKGFARTALKLTGRLLPAYLLWTLIYYLVRILIGDPGDGVTWLTMTLTFRGVAPLWFLGDLLLSELLFLVLQWAAKGRMLIHTAAALVFGALSCPTAVLLMSANELKLARTAQDRAEAALAGTKVIFDAASHIRPYLQIVVGRIVFTLFFLCCGYLAARLLARRRLPALDHLLLGIMGLLLLPILQFCFGGDINLHLCIIEHPLVFLATGLCGALGILSLCQGLCAILPLWAMRWLGRNSMGIMVLHYPPFPVMTQCAAWCLLLNPALAELPVQFLLSQTALTIAFCALLTFLLQRRLFL